ncbi:MAG: hypothetical protein FH758_09065 [Firmicutes bacterium]|nr:hypothetical protein [Bacillota bacterium]
MKLSGFFERIKSGAYEKLFDEDFMTIHTNSVTLREMFFKGGYQIKTVKDIGNIPDKELDRIVKENTDFETWEEMKKSAGQKYLKD